MTRPRSPSPVFALFVSLLTWLFLRTGRFFRIGSRRERRRWTPIVVLAGALLLAGPLLGASASGQEINAVLSGYGTVDYEARAADSLRHNFTASVSPVTLFQVGEDLLFESELDFEFEESSTETTLEHAQIHYLGFERVQMTVGKFHLPFGIWMHPSWINKMPDPPLLYGHAHGGVAEEALLPILFDVGAMAKGKIPLGSSWALGVSGWVSQGPRLAGGEGGHAHNGEGHGHEGGGHGEGRHGLELPPVGYGTNYADNNANKMVGGRLRLMGRTNLMVSLAGFWARYDAAGELGVTGSNLSVKWQPTPFDVRGEAILLTQQFFHEGTPETARRGGYYVQVTRRIGSFEPVVRFSHLPTTRFEGFHVQERRQQLALGLDYWITPSVPLKVAYQWGLEGPNALRLQWAIGF